MPLAESIRQAASLLKHAKRTVALTGAGVSTPSGIPDFRSPESGVWQNTDPMVASIYTLNQSPQVFYDWIRPLAHTIQKATPNPAHTALADMEAAGHLHAIITQNIDLLHSKAGSREVYEVHGHTREATCLQCGEREDAEPHIERLVASGQVPACSVCGGTLKPDMVLFGEQLPEQPLMAAHQAARTCDAMLVAGSSLTVTPVSDLPGLALASGARLVIVNFEPTHMNRRADVVIQEDVATVLPRIAFEMGIQ